MLCVFCPGVTSCFRCFRRCCSGISVCIYILFVSDQYASRLSVVPDSPFAHMIPPGEIIDTQIGEATLMSLWCTVFGSVGSFGFALMGLYQHTDWWNLISYIGTRAPLPHTAMFPVRKRKNPQIALRNRDMRQQMNDGKAAERNPIKLDTVGSGV